MADVLSVSSIESFMAETSATTATAIYAASYRSAPMILAKLRGGGLLRRLDGAADADGVMIFKRSEIVPVAPTYWMRDLDGGTLDAYMAGAVGDGVLDANGAATGTDDSEPIQNLIDYYRDSAREAEKAVPASIRLGDGVFLVEETLNVTRFKFSPRGWRIDGTGATLLGRIADKPVIDFTDSRFGTLASVQIIGSSVLRPSCGIRIGRNADNAAANQMTMGHVGVRGYYKIAALLNVASEQHTSIACEYTNDAEGPVYGYFADAFNCAQWGTPVEIASCVRTDPIGYTITTSIEHNLSNDDVILPRPASASPDTPARRLPAGAARHGQRGHDAGWRDCAAPCRARIRQHQQDRQGPDGDGDRRRVRPARRLRLADPAHEGRA